MVAFKDKASLASVVSCATRTQVHSSPPSICSTSTYPLADGSRDSSEPTIQQMNGKFDMSPSTRAEPLLERIPPTHASCSHLHVFQGRKIPEDPLRQGGEVIPEQASVGVAGSRTEEQGEHVSCLSLLAAMWELLAGRGSILTENNKSDSLLGWKWSVCGAPAVRVDAGASQIGRSLRYSFRSYLQIEP